MIILHETKIRYNRQADAGQTIDMISIGFRFGCLHFYLVSE